MRLEKFICGGISIKLPYEPSDADEKERMTVWEINSGNKLVIEAGEEIYGVLSDGRIIDGIFEYQDSYHRLSFSNGETFAPEQFKLLGKVG